MKFKSLFYKEREVITVKYPNRYFLSRVEYNEYLFNNSDYLDSVIIGFYGKLYIGYEIERDNLIKDLSEIITCPDKIYNVTENKLKEIKNDLGLVDIFNKYNTKVFTIKIIRNKQILNLSPEIYEFLIHVKSSRFNKWRYKRSYKKFL